MDLKPRSPLPPDEFNVVVDLVKGTHTKTAGPTAIEGPRRGWLLIYVRTRSGH